MKEYSKVLKNKDFFLLWLGQGVSDLGSKISFLGLTWLIIKITGKASSVSLLFILLTIPSIILGPLAGVLVDKWDKKKIIVLSDIIRGFLAFGMVLTDKLTIIYILAFSHSIITVFFSPAIKSSIPRIVKKDNLVTANSLSSSTRQISELVGPVFSGILISAFGIKSAFFINGISFIISAISEMWIHIPKSEIEKKENQAHGFLSRDFKEGLNYIKSNSIVKFVIFFFAVCMFPMGALPILNVVLFKEILQFNSTQYGLLMSVNGIGLLAGTFIMGKWGKKFSELKIIVFGVALYGIGYVALAFSKPFIIAGFFFFIIGIFTTLVNIAYGTYIQKVVDEDKMGRVFSIDIAIGNVVGLVSMALAGIFADTFGTITVICVGGLILAILSFLASRIRTYKEYVHKSKYVISM